MASRYLLIEFDDEKSAMALKDRIDTATRAGRSYRVVGLFAKPQAPYCECNKELTTQTQTSTLKRGQKLGWMVCTQCKRPAPVISHLKNLLSAADIIKPKHFRRGAYDLMFYFWGISAPTQAVTKEQL